MVRWLTFNFIEEYNCFLERIQSIEDISHPTRDVLESIREEACRVDGQKMPPKISKERPEIEILGIIGWLYKMFYDV